MTYLLAVHGSGFADPQEPIVHTDDLALLRGDGVFEVWLVTNGRPLLLEEHLDRLYRSAGRMEMLLPKRAAIEDFLRKIVAAWPRDRDGVLRLVCTRGPAGADEGLVFGTLSDVHPSTSEYRRNGIRLHAATNGFSADLRGSAPWLLGGVKSLSYAVNQASQRWAESQGADDMLWMSTEGYALETTSYSLVWLTGGLLCTVPAWTGIVAGTTSATLASHATRLGLTATEALVTLEELQLSDAVWITGAISGILEVVELNGRPMRRSTQVVEARKLIGYPTQ